MSVTCASVAVSTTIFPPKYSHNKGFVISSEVGPKPPVKSMIEDFLLSASNAAQMSSQTSPTATLFLMVMPALLSSWAIQALLVSIT